MKKHQLWTVQPLHFDGAPVRIGKHARELLERVREAGDWGVICPIVMRHRWKDVERLRDAGLIDISKRGTWWRWYAR